MADYAMPFDQLGLWISERVDQLRFAVPKRHRCRCSTAP
jgi:hypothetical protein